MRLTFLILLVLVCFVLGALSCSSPSLLGNSNLRCSLDELVQLNQRPNPDSNADTAPIPPAAENSVLRVAAFNIRSGFGPENERGLPNVEARLRKIAAAIVEQGAPDVVGLNEVDFSSRRSGFMDQAAFIAEQLERAGWHYNVVRGSTWRRDVAGREVDFGNALLVRHPVVRANRCHFNDFAACGESAKRVQGLPQVPLSQPWAWLSQEPRGVVVVDFSWRGLTEVRAIVTHLDPYSAQARETQAAQVIAGLVPSEGPVVLLGDMNTVPVHLTLGRRWFQSDRAHDVLTTGRLYDARAEAAGGDLEAWRRFATYPADSPRWPLDGIFASAEWVTTDLEVMGSGLSDHLGLVGSLTLADSERRTARLEQLALSQRKRLRRIEQCDAPSGDGASLLAWLARAAQSPAPPVEYSLVR